MDNMNTTFEVKCPGCGRPWTYDFLPKAKPHVCYCVPGAKGCGTWFAASLTLTPKITVFGLVEQQVECADAEEDEIPEHANHEIVCPACKAAVYLCSGHVEPVHVVGCRVKTVEAYDEP